MTWLITCRQNNRAIFNNHENDITFISKNSNALVSEQNKKVTFCNAIVSYLQQKEQQKGHARK